MSGPSANKRVRKPHARI